MIPIFIVHKGNQKYLEYSLRSCEQYHDVHLLGDSSNKNLTDNWCNIEEIESEFILEFDKVYKHMSTNYEWFEKICFYRYIYMYEYAKSNKIDSFFHCDSDLILLHSLNNIKLYLDKYSVALMRPQRQDNFRYTASPHISYWTLDGLKEFIEFFLFTYKNNIGVLQEKYQYHKSNNLPGGICDMTLLYLYSEYSPKVFNLFDLKDISLDYNVSSVENYGDCRHKLIFGVKKIKVIKNKLYFVYNDSTKIVLCLHMQGRAKLFMQDAYNKKYHYMMSKVILLNLVRKIRNLMFF
ncbi:TPA: hypothetical protein ACMDNB_002768 [Vibrio cholerae]